MPRNEPADALPQVVSWLAALWGVELLDHLLTPMLMSGATQKGVSDAIKKLLEVIVTSRRAHRTDDETGVTTEDWRP